MNFTDRIETEEIMDREELSMKELKNAYRDIHLSNVLLGGYRPTFQAILDLCEEQGLTSFRVLDVGCGEGSMLRYLAARFRRKGYDVHFLGLDLNTQAINLGKQQSSLFPEIEFLEGDFLDKSISVPKCEFVISTLTLHHFKDAEIPAFLSRCLSIASIAVIINDLQRSAWAYRLFKIFSTVFIRSGIAKKDGLMSIRKGFTRKNLEEFSNGTKMGSHVISWKWAFRYVWLLRPQRLNPL